MTTFRGACMRRTNLTDAKCRGVDFSGADLTEAILIRTDLRGADFTKAVLDDANLSGAIWDRRTRWPSGFVPPESTRVEYWVVNE